MSQIRKLAASNDADIVKGVERIWGKVRVDRDPQRAVVIDRVRELVQKNISKADLGMALTAKVSACSSGVQNYNCTQMIDNPFMKWSDINPSYPDVEIRVYGPPTTSGTRGLFVEMVNEKGAYYYYHMR